ncbi:cupin domain-containing protein [Muriicola soli]|uniref:Cupin domain-containing protein n=1 Tax=Muriicola soli TaxID=2507538 RepID=A0A411EBH7_9FLAO|nr:cupin domain-containing protein [Muriicola soli]QBA64884.1 cupin domain-containing protein [Muriicola soli]
MKIHLDNIAPREIIPGYLGKMIHGQKMTLVYWEVTQNAEVPEHAHENEQIMQVLEGEFEFTVDGSTAIYKAGELVIIPPNVLHKGRALTHCRLMDVFSPVRDAYK